MKPCDIVCAWHGWACSAQIVLKASFASNKYHDSYSNAKQVSHLSLNIEYFSHRWHFPAYLLCFCQRITSK